MLKHANNTECDSTYFIKQIIGDQLVDSDNNIVQEAESFEDGEIHCQECGDEVIDE